MVVPLPNNEFNTEKDAFLSIVSGFDVPEGKYQPVGIPIKRTNSKTKKDFILGGTVHSQLPIQTVSNTITSTVVAVYPFEKFAFYEGNTIRTTIAGSYGTTTGTDTVQVVVGFFNTRQTVGSAISGTPIAAAAVTSPATPTGNYSWNAYSLTIIRGVGTANGFIDTRIHGSFNGAGDDSAGAEAFDDSEPHDLVVYVTWDAADSNNTITLRQFVVEVIR